MEHISKILQRIFKPSRLMTPIEFLNESQWAAFPEAAEYRDRRNDTPEQEQVEEERRRRQ